MAAPEESGDASLPRPKYRMRRNAAQRRSQALRSEARFCLRLLKGVNSIIEHRGNALSPVGQLVQEVLQTMPSCSGRPSHMSGERVPNRSMPTCRHWVLGKCSWGQSCRFTLGDCTASLGDDSNDYPSVDAVASSGVLGESDIACSDSSLEQRLQEAMANVSANDGETDTEISDASLQAKLDLAACNADKQQASDRTNANEQAVADESASAEFEANIFADLVWPISTGRMERKSNNGERPSANSTKPAERKSSHGERPKASSVPGGQDPDNRSGRDGDPERVDCNTQSILNPNAVEFIPEAYNMAQLDSDPEACQRDDTSIDVIDSLVVLQTVFNWDLPIIPSLVHKPLEVLREYLEDCGGDDDILDSWQIMQDTGPKSAFHQLSQAQQQYYETLCIQELAAFATWSQLQDPATRQDSQFAQLDVDDKCAFVNSDPEQSKQVVSEFLVPCSYLANSRQKRFMKKQPCDWLPPKTKTFRLREKVPPEKWTTPPVSRCMSKSQTTLTTHEVVDVRNTAYAAHEVVDATNTADTTQKVVDARNTADTTQKVVSARSQDTDLVVEVCLLRIADQIENSIGSDLT